MADSLLPWQSLTLQLRGSVDLIILGGGRGGGKTHCALVGLVAHCAELGKHASPLIVRESHSGLSESMLKVYDFAIRAFGRSCSYNKADQTITLPSGGHIHGASLHEGESSYLRWQGRNLTGLWVEEAGNLSAQHFAFMRRLESNLRPPIGFKAERWWTCNPGGKSHTTLLRNWIGKSPPWKAARDHAGLSYVWIPSIYKDNDHIDKKEYRRALTASVGSDQVLADAWLTGTWVSISSAMFPANPEVHLIPAMPPDFLKARARFTCGCDWGTSAPATAILIAQIKEPLFFQGHRLPFGSLIAVDETSTVVSPHDLSIGSGLDPRSFADMVHVMLGKWHCPNADVYVDDAKGLKGDTVVEYFQDADLNVYKPNKKSRVEGWDIIRQHLAFAETRRGPPLYFTTAVPFLFQTLVEAPRGTLNPRDLDPKWNEDHFLDGFSYGMKEVAGGPRSSQGTVIGAW